ncbi:MAG TPA: hypothetical protein DDZ80_27980 [Cyanobacteria bacterium UBA8803]|nr:hypothetical protein [Cyanobacteria bacterium UBA9273]HBL62104.1 hypothetical protein [Cyanobacteria bacterium UBA8803]
MCNLHWGYVVVKLDNPNQEALLGSAFVLPSLDSLGCQELSDRAAESVQGGMKHVMKIEPLTIKQKTTEVFSDISTMVHEIGHAHGRGHAQPVTISWMVDFNA